MDLPADLIITGARVRTLDPGRPAAAAVACRDGQIAAVGSAWELAGLRGRRTEVMDADGAVIIPGLSDAHCHPLWGARAMRDADLSCADGLQEALALLGAAATQRPAGDWVVAHGLRREWFGGPITGAVLDPVAGGRPVFASFLDGHGALANPAALGRAGVSGPREFGDASQIVCGPDGSPTGELREPSAMEAVRGQIPPLTAARRRALYRTQLSRMARLGLVCAHVMDDAPDDLDDLAALEDDGELPVRLELYLWLQPTMDDAQIDAALARSRRAGRRWRVRGVKFFLDGVVDQGTAWLGARDPAGRTTYPNWPEPDRYARVVARCAAAGLGCATHAIGDLAVRSALDAYASTAPLPAAQPPCRIEHVELCDPADLERFAALGVVASMQPAHIASVSDDPDRHWDGRLDSARRSWGWSTAGLTRARAILALGSDWPVADADPRIGMMWARLRHAPEAPSRVYRPEEALTAEDALAGYTIGAARAVGDPAAGRIMVGARADLTVLGEDPVDCDAARLPNVAVLATVVGGTVGYRSGDV